MIYYYLLSSPPRSTPQAEIGSYLVSSHIKIFALDESLATSCKVAIGPSLTYPFLQS